VSEFLNMGGYAPTSGPLRTDLHSDLSGTSSGARRLLSRSREEHGADWDARRGSMTAATQAR